MESFLFNEYHHHRIIDLLHKRKYQDKFLGNIWFTVYAINEANGWKNRNAEYQF